MNERLIVPLGYPHWITATRDEVIKKKRKCDFYVAMAALNLEDIKQRMSNQYEITFKVNEKGRKRELIDKFIVEWMQRLTEDAGLQGVPALNVNNVDGVFNTGRFFEWVVPIGTHYEGDDIKAVFLGAMCMGITPEHVHFIYDNLSKVRMFNDATDSDFSEEEHEESDYPTTTMVDIVYSQAGRDLKTFCSAYRIEGNQIIPGVSSLSGGMVMDVEARRLKPQDVFFMTDDKTGYTGNAVVHKVEGVLDDRRSR